MIRKNKNEDLSIIREIWHENNIAVLLFGSDTNDTILDYITKYDRIINLQFLLLNLIKDEDINNWETLKNSTFIDLLINTIQNNDNNTNRCQKLINALINDGYQRENYQLFTLLLNLDSNNLIGKNDTENATENNDQYGNNLADFKDSKDKPLISRKIAETDAKELSYYFL